MKIAYFDCFSGVSGDMILGSLADLEQSGTTTAEEDPGIIIGNLIT